MRHRTRFGNCNDVTASDSPGQRNSSRRATACCANTGKRGITQQTGAGAAERRIGHYWHAMLLAPWQQIIFNAAVAEVVTDLVSRATIALWNMEQVLHVADGEIGNTPCTNLFRRAQIFKRRHDAGEVSDLISPVQQIEVEMIGSETGKARVASPRHAVARDVSGQHF